MKMLPLVDTIGCLGSKVIRNRMILSEYDGRWQCACGKTHYKIDQSDIVCQGFWRVLVHCPEDPSYLTAVKVNMGLMGLKFKNYESLAGTKIETPADALTLRALQNKLG